MLLAIIPARGGSKRLPGKNIAPFGGRPLIAWSILAARAMPEVACVVVTTDDPAIAAVAKEWGAEVVDRPAELAGDETPTLDALIHAALAMAERGVAFDAVLLLQPTNPLRPLDMLRAAVARFRSEPCESLIGVSRRPLKLGQVVDGAFVPTYAFGTQSRLMPPVTYENGVLYIMHRRTLLDDRSLTGARALAFEVERPFDEVDIDEAVDLVIGEAVLAAVRARLGY
jgi:N-acylneuraminate cytidylyltransferase